MAAGSVMLALEGVHLAIGGRTILDDVRFELHTGEYLAVVGPNGAGKSTLLKCLTRVVRGAGGKIVLAGRPLADYPQRELARRVSYVPQADTAVLPYRVDQFVMMGRYPYLRPLVAPGSEDRAAVSRALEQTGTTDLASRLLPTLSGGERQKVYIAAALAQGAPLMLLDEPTSFLDYRHQAEVQTLLGSLNREHGVTILAVTHDLNAAVLQCHRVLALRAGKVAFTGLPADLMQSDVLEAIYGTVLPLVRHPTAGVPMVLPAGTLASAPLANPSTSPPSAPLSPS